MKVAKSIFLFLKNKYVLSILGVTVWIVFLDKNNVFSQLELTEQHRKLELERDYFKDKIDANKKALEELHTSPSSLEKFARETYLMKKDGEDLFVIVPDTVK